MKPLFALAALLTLTACAPPPQPMPLPYRFTVGSITDARSEAELTDPMPYGFNQTTFLQNLRKAMPYTLFGSENASLNLTLTHFETTTFDDSFALSMAMKVEGVDAYNRPLAHKPIMCSEVQNRGFELDEMAQQVWADKNTVALTPQARNAKMWDKLFDACVRNLADQFGQVLVQQQTVNGKAN
ncbi:MAG: hypothetical protein WAZ18_04000 [Alphaproteobacteria bacterium]